MSTDIEAFRTHGADGHAVTPRARHAAPARKFGQVVTTGDADDLIDLMLHRSRGDVLAPAGRDVRGGEYDYVASGQVSRRDLRRLTAAGLFSTAHGMRADVLAHICDWQDGADEFVAWWIETGIAGLDARAARRAGDERDQREQPRPDDTLAAYLDRLVFAEKFTYAAAYAAHVTDGATCPADPGTKWADKARRKVDALVRVAA